MQTAMDESEVGARKVVLIVEDGAQTRKSLERAVVQATWAVADVVDLDRAVAQFSTAYQLTPRQAQLLTTMMHAAERGERPEINENTRKAGLRRILAKTGHASFEQVRSAIKQLARGDHADS